MHMNRWVLVKMQILHFLPGRILRSCISNKLPSDVDAAIPGNTLQFITVSLSHPALCNPMDCSMPGFPVHHQLTELAQLMSIESVMPSNHLILCIPFSSCLQSFPASGSFEMSQFFASCRQSIGVSASAPVLPVNIQDWFPLGLTS